ncbi:hypothetical protein [Streptomyces sp. NPDC018584]|uniref:class III lanthionine synthetase LanKC N-terminal domain-containing protein n=1 Tax=unclassified Streptomyces TaxID=2593676 RepID=UPI0037A01F59
MPDVRGPTFQVPDWVELPGFLAPHLTARGGARVADLPYVYRSFPMLGITARSQLRDLI